MAWQRGTGPIEIHTRTCTLPRHQPCLCNRLMQRRRLPSSISLTAWVSSRPASMAVLFFFASCLICLPWFLFDLISVDMFYFYVYDIWKVRLHLERAFDVCNSRILRQTHPNVCATPFSLIYAGSRSLSAVLCAAVPFAARRPDAHSRRLKHQIHYCDRIRSSQF